MKTISITHEKAIKKGDLKLQTTLNTNTIQKIAQLKSKVIIILIRYERFLLQKTTQLKS